MAKFTIISVNSFFLCLLLLASGKVSAQVASTRGWFNGVSKELTVSGKPVLYSYEHDRENRCSIITIYDEDMQVEKRLNIENFHEESMSGYEYAKVMPSGVEIKSSTISESNVLSTYYGIDLTRMTSVDEINALLETTGYKEVISAYLNIDGKICIGDNNKFFGEVFFGKKYNKEYLTLLDGKEVYVSAQYEYIYPMDNLLWELDIDDVHNHSYSYELVSDVNFYDYDDSNPAKQYVYVTQKLFNDDEKWEYLSPVYEMRTTYNEPQFINEDDNGLTLRRSVYFEAMLVKYNIVSEDGSVLFQILPPKENLRSWDEGVSLYRLNGKLYLEVDFSDYSESSYDDYNYNVLYQIDPKANSVKTIRSVKSEERFASISGGSIQMYIDDNEDGQDVLLSNMTGQVLGKNHIPAGQHSAQMNASHLPQGIYNVTLMQRGKVQKNQKIRIK